MTRDEDRVAVPTNGRRPYPAPNPSGEPRDDDPRGEDPDADQDIETAAFTPTQMAVGFGILASLVLFLLRRRRRRR